MANKTPRTPTPEQLKNKMNAALQAIKGDNETVCAVMAATFIDHALGAILKRHFIASGTSDKVLQPPDHLLKPNGAIGSLQAKIDVLYCLGLLAQTGKENIETIALIRNKFAHSLDSASFNDSEICEWCGNLKLPKGRQWNVSGGKTEVISDLDRGVTEPRARFELVARSICLTLMDRLSHIKRCEKLTGRWV
jgi:DNA-binding MltR family transcriptional regulator